MDEPTNSCQDCRFWVKMEHHIHPERSEWGECHRFPPPFNIALGIFPGLPPDAWCGEFSTKTPVKELPFVNK